MCEGLKQYIETDLYPFVREAMEASDRQGEADRRKELQALLETFDEIVADIVSGEMDAWECGELYEEFRRHRAAGDFLDRIS